MPKTPARRRRAVALFMSLLGLSASTFAALGVVVSTPTPASAHAGLVSSTPEEGASLDALPGEVVLTFSEEISEPAYVVVRTADGTTYEDGRPTIDGATVTQPVAPSDRTGPFTLAYRVVSKDGHVVTGELEFTVEGDSAAADSPDASAPGDEATPAPDADANAESDDSSAAPYVLAAALALLVVVVTLISRRRKPKGEDEPETRDEP